MSHQCNCAICTLPRTMSLRAQYPNWPQGPLANLSAPATAFRDVQVTKTAQPSMFDAQQQGRVPMQHNMQGYVQVDGYIAPAGFLDTLKKYGGKGIRYATEAGKAKAAAEAYKEMAMQKAAAQAVAPAPARSPYLIPALVAGVAIVAVLVLKK